MRYFYICLLYIFSTCYTVCAQNINISKGSLQIGHYYVDLGLLVPWAISNIGLSYPRNTSNLQANSVLMTHGRYVLNLEQNITNSRANNNKIDNQI